MSSQSELVIGDIAVVVNNRTGAHKVKDGTQQITPGEKITVAKLEKPHTAFYHIPRGYNSIYIQDIEKIYYNDSFKLAWDSFGIYVKPPRVDD